MARRTRTYTVDDKKSRDHGKSFLLTEMDAEKAEWWAIKALLAIGMTESEIDFNAPLAQMAGQGFSAMFKADPARVKPLLDEMMECVQIKLPGSNTSRDLLPGDIEEVKTRILLRKEVLALHVDFFTDGGE
jgi:hypothetical protein